MKIRSCFVSNSSSSSFIVVGNSGNKLFISDCPQRDGQLIFDSSIGHVNDPESRLNFAFELIYYYGVDDDLKPKIKDFKKLIKKFCKRHDIKFKRYKKWMMKRCEWNIDYDKPYDETFAVGYIDHQSCLYESPDLANIIFKDYESFENFILDKETKFQITRG